MPLIIFWLTIGAAVAMYYFTVTPFSVPWEKRDRRRNVLIMLFNILTLSDSLLIAKMITGEKILYFSFDASSFPITIITFVVISIIGYVFSMKYLNYCFKKGRKTCS